MAEAKKKRRVVRQAKPETVRERAAKASEAPVKSRRVRGAVSHANKPLKATGHAAARIFHPFRFLLRPFKTRPARFVGRILAKILLLNYFRSSWQELREVEWPNRRQTVQLTLAVFAFSIFLALIVAGVDWVLDKVFKEILLS